MRLSMKQLLPTSIDEYIAEHKVGDMVSGRVINTEGQVRIELGEGIQAPCTIPATTRPRRRRSPPKTDLSSLSSMLQSRGKARVSQPRNASPSGRTDSQLPHHASGRSLKTNSARF